MVVVSGQAKKVMLFVVEGPSEETALALVFERLFAGSAVRFDVVHGDATTMTGIKNARDTIRDQVVGHVARQERQQNYGWCDLARIVHIVDTDGAFIGDEKVIPSGGGQVSGSVVYKLDCVIADNPDGIRLRNKKKADALRQLSSISEITYSRRKVPYRVYYLSRNLEHALHNVADNLTNREKERLAQQFRRDYKDNLGGFVSLLRDVIGVQGDYKATWSYIQEGDNSLKRAGNLHLVLPESCQSA